DALAAMEANRSTTQEETNRTETTTRTFFRVRKVEDGDRVKYAACTMLNGTLTWWNPYVWSVGIDVANATPWSEFKQMLIKKYYPQSEAIWPKTAEPLPEQQIRETKTTRGTHLPALVVDKNGIIGMNVQKQGTEVEETRSEATRIKDAKIEETMVKETRMGINLEETLASGQIMLMIKERPSRVS
ncbi:hypothetical protein Tco_1249554, partial [Tanacetum coccineum]